MENNTEKLEVRHHVTGFILSLILTLVAFYMVSEKLFSNTVLVIAIGSLAVIQAMIQLFCFLDLGNEPKPRWNLIHFLFMALVLIILVAGSMWIMHHLNYNMMPHMYDEMDTSKHMTY